MFHNTDKLCAMALREAGIVEIGETPETVMRDFVIDLLNEIITTEQGIGENKFAFTAAETTIKLNKNSSTDPDPDISLPADFLRAKTQKLKIEQLDSTGAVSSTYEMPISLSSHTEFFNFDQTLVAMNIPSKIYIQTVTDVQTIQICPAVAVQALSNVYLVLTYEKITPLTSVALVSGYIDVPDMLTEMFKMKLALKICVALGIPDPTYSRIKEESARLTTAKAEAGNQRNVETSFHPIIGNQNEIQQLSPKDPSRFNTYWSN